MNWLNWLSFQSPNALWALLALPALVMLYFWLQRRTRRAIRYSNVALVRAAMGPASRFKRHIPPLLVLLAAALLLFSLARPNAFLYLPSQYKTIILAMDVSLSMQADDMDPNRISASRAAAIEFVRSAPSDVKIGIVEFAGNATQVQIPTTRREDLVGAIERSELQRGTATGSALLASLSMLFPEAGIKYQTSFFTSPPFNRAGDGGLAGASLDEPDPTEKKPEDKIEPGSFKSGLIILLTDGRRTVGPDPVKVAKRVAERGVKAYTVGFGTVEGGAVDIEGWRMYLKLDDEALKKVAEQTGGEYFHATSEQGLKNVYESLSNKLVVEGQHTEISALLAGVAALLTILAAMLSFFWFHRAR
ncbi:MAG: VWA domain-containing protein [Burkholderiaceae bacterium]